MKAPLTFWSGVWLTGLHLALNASCASASGCRHDLSGNLISPSKSVLNAPLLLSQPSVQVSYTGGNAGVIVTTSDPSTAFFQWLFNGTKISGATNSGLLVTGVATANRGGCSVIVSNASGVVTSSVIPIEQ